MELFLELTKIEEQLWEQGKYSIYLTQIIADKAVTDEEKKIIGVRILEAPLPVAMGMAKENNSRVYPPDYEGD